MSKKFRFTSFLFLFLIILTTSGCARTYVHDRLRDLGDCVTCTVGLGFGPTINIGPFQTGLGSFWDVGGYRDGTTISGLNSESCTILSIESVNSLSSRTSDYYPKRKWNGAWEEKTIQKGACFEYHYPFIGKLKIDPEIENIAHANQYYTQIEATCSVILGFRVGVNPGEFLDFITGFMGADIYGDDIYPYNILWAKIYPDKIPPTDPMYNPNPKNNLTQEMTQQ